MAQQAQAHRVHSIVIPTAGVSLVVPSATIAEVVNVSMVTPVPYSPEWNLGVIGWRGQAVPVVSFEGLMGDNVQTASLRSKIVIFYPLQGCKDSEFFAFLSSAEPQPYIVDEAVVVVDGDDIPGSPYIAAAIKINERVAGIPNMDEIKKTFFSK